MININKIAAVWLLIFLSQNTFSEKSNFAIGTGGGTTGVSLSTTFKLTDNLNLRGIYANYDFNAEETKAGINYDINIELDTFSLLLDYHPFASSGFRLSLGAVKNGISFTATSTQTTATVRVGSTDFNAADIGTLNASVSYRDYAPYVGIGWGNAVFDNKNLTFALDVGVIGIDNPDVQLSSTGANPAVQSILNSELINEQQELKNKLDDFDLYPVVNVSLNYQF